MKLPAKVVNAFRDVFRTVFSIKNVFRTSRTVLYREEAKYASACI